LVASRGCRPALFAARIPRTAAHGARIASYTTTPRLRQDAFHTQIENAAFAPVFSSLNSAPDTPQTLTEKIVQRYSVGLAPGKKVKAGDYVTVAPGSFIHPPKTGKPGSLW
jgi:homoaconitate hydratase